MKKSLFSHFAVIVVLAVITLPADAIAFQSDGIQEVQSLEETGSGYGKGITPARARSLVGGVLGLFSLIIGWRAKARATANSGTSRALSMAALIVGVVAAILSIAHLAINAGGFGTGGGKAGAVVALLLGLSGAALGVFAMRTRRGIS